MCQILSRLKEYIEYRGITVAAFEKSIGMSNASFSKQLKNKRAIGTDKLENILNVYSDISPEWLLTGNGNMLKAKTADAISPSTVISVDKSQSSTEDILETRPRVPFDAAAGSLSIVLGSVSEYECERMPVIPSFPRYDFTIIARGDSMAPDFLSGDELACTFVKESSFIQWGRPHVLDTAQGVVLKKIFNNHESIICRSINSDYPDFEVPKQEIFHIALVVGLLRHF